MKKYAYELLRSDLLYYIQKLSFHGDELAKEAYIARIETASEEDLENIARECNIPLKEYEMICDPVIKR